MVWKFTLREMAFLALAASESKTGGYIVEGKIIFNFRVIPAGLAARLHTIVSLNSLINLLSSGFDRTRKLNFIFTTGFPCKVSLLMPCPRTL